MSIAQLDALYTAAVAAMDSGDYDTAILKLMALKVRMVTTPNLSRALGGGGSQSIGWNRGDVDSIDSLIRQCRQLQAAVATGGMFQTSKIVYARPTA